MKRYLNYNFIIIIIAFGIILTTACNQSKTKLQLAQIDSLTLLLDKTELMLKEINSDSITTMLKDVEYKNEAIYNYGHTKLSMKEHSDFFQFKDVEKLFKSYLLDHVKYNNDYNYSRKQLADLKNDVEKHTIKGNKFDEYYQSENTSISNLFNMVKSSLYKVKQSVERYKMFNPNITKLISDRKIKINTDSPLIPKEESGDDD